MGFFPCRGALLFGACFSAEKIWRRENCRHTRAKSEQDNRRAGVQQTLSTLSKNGVGFRSLTDLWADTTTPHGRLMGAPQRDIDVIIVGHIARSQRQVQAVPADHARCKLPCASDALLGPTAGLLEAPTVASAFRAANYASARLLKSNLSPPFTPKCSTEEARLCQAGANNPLEI